MAERLQAGKQYDLGDDRVVEFVGCEWAPLTGDEEPGTIGIEVFYVLNGEAGSVVVYPHVDDWFEPPLPDRNDRDPIGDAGAPSATHDQVGQS